MKRNILFLLSMLFFTFVVTSPVVAQEATPSLTPTPTPVAYQLPYPGILPGHPFYFLKVIRDSWSGFLISNPLKKAEFDLLQADKYMSSAQYLFNQKKDLKLILSALNSSEDYFSDALQKTTDAKKQGMDSKDLLKKLQLANLKHQEVVSQMIKSAKGDDAKKLIIELGKIKEFAKKTK